jgi:trimethylamine--corrinoid protein Co-methyltransferase
MTGIKPGLHKIVKVLSPSQLRDVHKATITLLEKVGVIFEEEKALELFASAGARVDNEVVHLSSEMVENLLKRCPSKVTLYARNPRKSVHLGTNRVHYTNGYGTTFVKDLETGAIREARLEDLRDFTYLGDYLNNVHYILTQVIPQDIPPEAADVYQAWMLLKSTEKHVGLSVTKSTYLDQVIEIGKLASGIDQRSQDQKFVFSLGTTPVSPLRFSRDGTIRLLKLSREGIVTRVVSGATCGGTSPVSLAGTLAVQNAEVIAGICLIQIVAPGNPVLYGTFAGPLDMMKGKQLLAAPESAILNAATAQLCRFYRIPFGYGTGGVADSAALDIQAGIEKTYTLLYTALSGVDVIHDAIGGLSGTAMVSSYEQMLVDDEICHMVNRGLKGITVTPESLALDLIEEVGHHGNYLSTEHTHRHFRDEMFLPRFFDRRTFNERKEGELEILETARRQAKGILSTHRPKPHPPEVQKKMDKILEGVLKDLHVESSAFSQLSGKREGDERV